jgi:O-antigen/teichoic acid export membrane protein
MLVFSSPLVLSGVAVFITLYIDRLMISHFLSLNEVGLFGLGYRIASMAGLVMVGFQSALTPLIYSNYQFEGTPKSLASIFRFFVVFALFIILILGLFSSEFIKLMATESFYSASSIIVFLAPAIFLSNMYIFAPGISIAKKTYFILYINIVGACLNVVLNFTLIPQMGIVGAATSTLLTYLVVFSMYMHFSQKFYYVPHKWPPIIYAAFMVFLTAYILPKLTFSFLVNLVLKLTSILFIFLFFIVIDLIKLSEISELKNKFKKYLNKGLNQ